MYFRLHPYKQTSLKINGEENLKPRYYGPYKVIRKIGEVAYELELSKGRKFIIYFMFLVSRKLLVIKLSFYIHSLLWMMKDSSHLFRKRFWRQGREYWGAEQSKNTWCNGRIYKFKMPHRKRRIFCIIQIWNFLRTSNIWWGDYNVPIQIIA